MMGQAPLPELNQEFGPFVQVQNKICGSEIFLIITGILEIPDKSWF